jgi:phosphatidylinositol alpha-1,6-mannosyltransferase
MLADPAAAAAMGQAGRAWVAEQWRWEKMAGKLTTLLDGGASRLTAFHSR